MSDESQVPIDEQTTGPGSQPYISGSRLERILRAGQFAVCGEMGPPQSADGEVIARKTRHFLGYVDAVNLTDSQTAVVRMSSIASSVLAMAQGLEPIIQVTCRDRNRIAMQSDLLGAWALGIRNLLCLSGDHVIFGNHPQALNVSDIDSLQLIQMVRRMRDEKKFMSGDEMKVEPRFFLAAASNPFAPPQEVRVLRLVKKIRAGADFVQTQAIFDVPRFREYMKEVCDLGLHEKVFILAGVLPARSVKALRYMRDNVPGISIPDELIARMEGAGEPEQEGINLVVDIIHEIRTIDGVAGVHIMPALWESAIPRVVEQAGLLPRPEL